MGKLPESFTIDLRQILTRAIVYGPKNVGTPLRLLGRMITCLAE